jgi:hypothetical protein
MQKHVEDMNLWKERHNGCSQGYGGGGIRLELWLKQLPNGNHIKLVAPYVLTQEEKKFFLDIIKLLRTPTNYGAKL